MNEQYDYFFKICVVGDYGIGKSAFIESFVPESYFKKEKQIVQKAGGNFYVGAITIETYSGPKNCKIQIWDTGGHEHHRTIRPIYYKGAGGIMLFFDLANRDSFVHLNGWITEVRQSLMKDEKRRKKRRIGEIPILLVGNKSDLETFTVSPKEIERFIHEHNLFYIETSTKTKEGIIDSFYSITSLMVGIDVQSEIFLSKEIIYRPRDITFEKRSTEIQLTAQDLSNLSQKLILEKLDKLEKKIEDIKINETNLIEQFKLKERELKLKERELELKEKKLAVDDNLTSLKKDILVFVSYSTKDADLFKVKKIAESLSGYENIKNVLYWQEHMEDNIVKYMSDNLGKCDIMLLFCSPNALKSIPIEKEWTSADMMNKPIVPIFVKTEHIPPLLKSRLGIEFDTFDLQKTINEIYILIMKKMEKRIIDVKDLKTDF